MAHSAQNGATLAGFFRGARIRDALAAPRPDAARALVAEFTAHHRMRDCTETQLLALADLCARCGAAEPAREALDLALASGGKTHLAYYKLGRLELANGRFAEAAHAFRKGIEADAEFPHNWMGAARALHALGDRTVAFGHAEHFARFGVRPHGREELNVLGDLADHAFDAGDRTRPLLIYALLRRHGSERPRHIVRLAEGLITDGRTAEAADMLRGHEAASGPLDPWGRRALAQCLSQLGEHEDAIGIAAEVARAHPDNAGFTGTYLRVLLRSPDRDHLRAALADPAAPLSAEDRTELATRLKLSDGDLAGAAAALARMRMAARDRFFHLGIETAYAALDAGQNVLAATLASRLIEAAPSDPAAVILQVDIAFRRQDWDLAGDMLGRLGAEAQNSPHVVMKRLEHACFTRQDEDAARHAVRLAELAGPRGQFVLPLFRYSAERQDWQAVIDRAVAWLDRGFRYDQIGYVLFRAVRQTGRHAELRAAAEAVEGWQSSPDLLRLRNTIAYDEARSFSAIDAAMADPLLAADPALAHKLAVRRRVLVRAAGQTARNAVFLCTDRNYLCATIVALHGLAQAIDRASIDVFIVADDDIADLARDTTRAFTGAGLSLSIVPASSIVDDAAGRLAAGYGLFTSGHRLASAAYYRIYFARFLRAQGLHDRALYVDSDVLFDGDLDSALAAPLGGKPLAARPEPLRPEVVRAIAHHGLEDGLYFNSGVLVFDLRHRDLEAGLDASVAAILDDRVTLLYHDQCALNLGFRGRFQPLHARFNYPVGETTQRRDVPPGTRILHFLDRPKPWSAAHRGDASDLWFDRWLATADFIGARAADELFDQIQD